METDKDALERVWSPTKPVGCFFQGLRGGSAVQEPLVTYGVHNVAHRAEIEQKWSLIVVIAKDRSIWETTAKS